MQRWIGLFILLELLGGCATSRTASPEPEPAPRVPPTAIYFARHQIYNHDNPPPDILFVATLGQFQAAVQDQRIKTVYFDRTTIDQISPHELKQLYFRDVVIAGVNIPQSELATHVDVSSDLGLPPDPREYDFVSAIYAFTCGGQVSSGSFNEYVFSEDYIYSLMQELPTPDPCAD